MAKGFPRSALAGRYAVSAFREDDWHAHCGTTTQIVLKRWLPASSSEWCRLLNAGPGIYDVDPPGYDQYLLDLFEEPLRSRPLAVCGRIEQMPFRDSCFDVVVCVGEVLSYCDPAPALSEFQRVLRDDGLLIFDFPSSRSPRHWFSRPYGRAAGLFNDLYNNAEEPIWVYSPSYIQELLAQSRFDIVAKNGTHTLSAIARRLKLPFRTVAKLERQVPLLSRLTPVADVVTILARKASPS